MSDEPYSKVARGKWRDQKYRALSGPKPNAQTLWDYLLTAPRCTSIPGVLVVGVAGLADDLDWPVAATRKCLAEIETAGMALVDHEAKLIWLPNSLRRYNMPANPSTVLGWGTHWKVLPRCDLLSRVTDAFRDTLAAEDRRRSEEGRPGGLAAAFSVVLGEKSVSESGLQVGRKRRLSPASKEHGAKHGVYQGVQHGGEHGPEHGGEHPSRDARVPRAESREHAASAAGAAREDGTAAGDLTDLIAFAEELAAEGVGIGESVCKRWMEGKRPSADQAASLRRIWNERREVGDISRGMRRTEEDGDPSSPVLPTIRTAKPKRGLRMLAGGG